MKVLTALAAIALLAACAAPSTPEENKTAKEGGVTSQTDAGAVEHVQIKSCKVGDFGDVNARLVITNKGDDQASYAITAEAVKGKRRVAELNAFANNVRPGQTANTKAVGMVDGKGGDVECKLVSVDRF